jgi:hypothetical protein
VPGAFFSSLCIAARQNENPAAATVIGSEGRGLGNPHAWAISNGRAFLRRIRPRRHEDERHVVARSVVCIPYPAKIRVALFWIRV